jgi:hypothetical protein
MGVYDNDRRIWVYVYMTMTGVYMGVCVYDNDRRIWVYVYMTMTGVYMGVWVCI